MVFRRMFRVRPAETAGQALYAAAVAQARKPVFYTGLGAEDTPPGRFELYTLHVVLLLRRLKGQGAQAAETGQALFDAYVGGLDIALRELGTGDLSMAKKMKRLGQAFYGRVKAYEDAFAALPDAAPLYALFERTIGPQNRLLAYTVAAEADLAGQAIDDLLAGCAEFPEPAP